MGFSFSIQYCRCMLQSSASLTTPSFLKTYTEFILSSYFWQTLLGRDFTELFSTSIINQFSVTNFARLVVFHFSAVTGWRVLVLLWPGFTSIFFFSQLKFWLFLLIQNKSQYWSVVSYVVALYRYQYKFFFCLWEPSILSYFFSMLVQTFSKSNPKILSNVLSVVINGRFFQSKLLSKNLVQNFFWGLTL